ncbi:Thiol:disulfide interchange protein DsbA [Pseudoxanthomonas sp. GM95]|uniref:thiol:disulfide interchange protein DsbA/DsbL n=1 Tax=Pseudoxanthomonas sp. GM95 TaxID=1881043 RepID=UPI0008AADA8C|nr:thiol:disulfide interchange protein DsbA/DsbL [Pseudoxanthomonas sp. GM95]SEM12072.1 Thiol:disulfide interchange protein DsbA [Pseudoxanthomonas sp. GM95]
MKSSRIVMLCLLISLLAACSQPVAQEASSALPAAPASSPTADATQRKTPPTQVPDAAGPAEDTHLANDNRVTPPQGPAPIAGTDYIAIPDGQPFEPANGKIEVVEFFNYICPFCYQYSPRFLDWKSKLPSDVRVTYVPATFRPDFAVYARAFYAAEVLGISAKTHEAAYKAVHVDGTLPGEGQTIDESKIAQFYSQYGVTAEQFSATMKSFAVSARLQKARQFAIQSTMNSTPSIVVDGKYLVKGRSWDDVLRIADHLIAQERAAQKTH